MEFFDSTVDHEWPETPDQPPTPPPSPPPPAQLERESTPWETLQDLEDQRLFAVSVIIRRIVWADMYAHLPNVELDWELEGRSCCRVIGTKCYGQMFKVIERHLHTVYHIEHNNSSRIPRVDTPPPRGRQPQISEVTSIQRVEENPVQQVTRMEIPDIQESSNTLYTGTPACDKSSDSDAESEQGVIFIKCEERKNSRS